MRKFIRAGTHNDSSYYVECVDGVTIKAAVTLNGVEETKTFVYYSTAEKWIMNRISSVMSRDTTMEEYQ